MKNYWLDRVKERNIVAACWDEDDAWGNLNIFNDGHYVDLPPTQVCATVHFTLHQEPTYVSFADEAEKESLIRAWSYDM